MKVLVTGATGMVGRNLLEEPRAADHDVLAPGRAQLDLTDRASVDSYLARYRPDVIVHLAAIVGGIQANINEPVRFLADNARMALNLIQGARAAGVRRLLNVGSSCMYPRDFERPLRIADLLTGELEPTNEGYALAKLLSWKLCAYAMREDSVLQYKTLVPCNLYGRHDHFDPIRSHMVPAAIRKVAEAAAAGAPTVEIWGDGSARREFMYAGDLADFIWTWLPQIEALPEITNVGLGVDYSVLDYYREAADVVGFKGEFTFDPSRPAGMKRKLLDVSQQIEFGWTPPTSLREGFSKTYEFYRSSRAS